MRPENRPGSREWLWFMIGCLLPLAVLLVLAGSGWNVGSLLLLGVFLLCPISLLYIMLSGKGSGAPSGSPDSHSPGVRTGSGDPEGLHPR